MNRGDVWWYEHPDSEPRPHLILTRSEVIRVLNHILAAPATRTIRQIPTEVDLGMSDGMPSACVLSLDNTTLIRKAFCTRRITRLSAIKMREVCAALDLATGCD